MTESSAPGVKETVPAGLSGREQEVIKMACRGMTNPEIAIQLSVTVHAVKFHLASIYRKLGVANRTEAAVAFLALSAEAKAQ